MGRAACCRLMGGRGGWVVVLKEKVRSEEVSEARKATMRGWGKNFLTVENQQKMPTRRERRLTVRQELRSVYTA